MQSLKVSCMDRLERQERQRNYYRNHVVETTGHVRLRGNKRPYPLDERCELCRRKKNLRRKGLTRLAYHHWDDSDLSKGIWLCGKCHNHITHGWSAVQNQIYGRFEKWEHVIGRLTCCRCPLHLSYNSSYPLPKIPKWIEREHGAHHWKLVNAWLMYPAVKKLYDLNERLGHWTKRVQDFCCRGCKWKAAVHAGFPSRSLHLQICAVGKRVNMWRFRVRMFRFS